MLKWISKAFLFIAFTESLEVNIYLEQTKLTILQVLKPDINSFQNKNLSLSLVNKYLII